MKSGRTTAAAAFAALLAMVFTSLPAQAAEDEWKFEVTPYVWATGMNGDVTARNREAGFDYSFNDIVKYVDKGGGVLGGAQYDRWVFWGQVDYFQLSNDLNTPAGGKLTVDLTIATAAVGYQFDGWSKGQTFDVMIGEQHTRLTTETTFNAIGTFDNKRTLNDTVLVLRPSIPLSENWRFNPALAYGKGDSDSTYTLWPQFQYHFTKTWEARIGYRRLHYSVENDSGSEKLNITLSGPVLGIGATF
jgi:hypothetical protein